MCEITKLITDVFNKNFLSSKIPPCSTSPSWDKLRNWTDFTDAIGTAINCRIRSKSNQYDGSTDI